MAGEGCIRGILKQMSDGEVQMLVDEFLALSHEIERLPCGTDE